MKPFFLFDIIVLILALIIYLNFESPFLKNTLSPKELRRLAPIYIYDNEPDCWLPRKTQNNP